MEIAPDVHLIPGLVGTRPLQLFFLNGSERGVLLDSGCAPDPEKFVFPYLNKIGLGPGDIDLVINTHCDSDHCGGNHAVKAANPGTQISCGEADRPLIENPETMWRLRYNAYEDEHGIYYSDDNRKAIFDALGEAQPVDWTWRGGETLNLGGGWRVEIHHVPGHSEGHLAIFDLRSRTMFSGDAVQGSVYLDKDGAPILCPTYLQIDPYLSTIQYLGSLPIELLATCHWPLKHGTEIRRFLDESRGFVARADQLLLSTLRRFPEGASLRDLIDSVGPQLGSWPDAMNGEMVYALAGHMQRLVRLNKVTALRGVRPVRYKTGGNA